MDGLLENHPALSGTPPLQGGELICLNPPFLKGVGGFKFIFSF